MAVQPTYPGVYVQEVPSGVRTIMGVSTSVAVFIGRTRKGPLNEPVRCLNYSDFERTFSSEDPEGISPGNSEMARALRLFFLNGGTDCYAVRIANGAATATADLNNEGGVSVVKVEAQSAGTIGNTIRLNIDYDTRQPASTFNIEIFRWVENKAGQMIKVEVENWKNLSMDPASQQYAIKVVNEGSALVNLSALAGALPTPSFSQSGVPIPDHSSLAFWQGWKQILMGTGPVINTVWTGDSEISASGDYVGSLEKAYTFIIMENITIPGGVINVNWDDGTGNTGNINRTDYEEGSEIQVGDEGLILAFSAESLVAGESFRVPIQLMIQAAETPAAWTGTSEISASGEYEDSLEKTYTFNILADCTIPGGIININWEDSTGNDGNINLPDYEADTEIPVGDEGLILAFGAGNLEATESFTVPILFVIGEVIIPATPGDSTITVLGNYTGLIGKTYNFTINADSTIPDGTINITWDDGTGNTGTINFPDYEVDTEIPVGDEGLALAFAAGNLVANQSFTIHAHPRATQFRLSINKGLSYVTVNLDDINFDTDIEFDDTPVGAQARLAPAIESRINDLLEAAGSSVAVSMETGPVAPEGATALLRITSADNDVQIQPATDNDLTRILMLGAGRGGLEISRYTNARPAPGTMVDLGSSGMDGDPTQSEQYEEAFLVIDREVDIFNLMILPHDIEHTVSVSESLWGPASIFCKERRAFLLMDPPEYWHTVRQATDLADGVNRLRIGLVKDHSAIFYPPVIMKEKGLDIQAGPSGAIAGLMARIDANRGVWKAPAGTEADLRGITGLKYRFSDNENGVLNPQGVNTIRIFPNGIVNWGARTMDGADDFASEWKYIPVRRTALFIEESLYRGLKWVVFEPNDETLWSQIRLNVGAFMHNLFRQGAFQGQVKTEAYFVKCDKETTTQNDINLGIVNVWVGFAPLKPAEFVILYLQQMTGQVQV